MQVRTVLIMDHYCIKNYEYMEMHPDTILPRDSFPQKVWYKRLSWSPERKTYPNSYPHIGSYINATPHTRSAIVQQNKPSSYIIGSEDVDRRPFVTILFQSDIVLELGTRFNLIGWKFILTLWDENWIYTQGGGLMSRGEMSDWLCLSVIHDGGMMFDQDFGANYRMLAISKEHS